MTPDLSRTYGHARGSVNGDNGEIRRRRKRIFRDHLSRYRLRTNLHPDLVAERLLRFAGSVGRERVMAGSDCGFAQGPSTRRVQPSSG
jgi:hypothetical protein